MNVAQTHLSKLKACRKLAGGKAAGRRPRCCAPVVPALKGRRNSGVPSGRVDSTDSHRGSRPMGWALPPANFRQPSGLLA